MCDFRFTEILGGTPIFAAVRLLFRSLLAQKGADVLQHIDPVSGLSQRVSYDADRSAEGQSGFRAYT